MRRIFLLGAVLACGSREAPLVELDVVADSSGLSAQTTNLGYRVELEEAELMIEDLQFSVGGEASARGPLQPVWDVLVPSAHAHPGHEVGGEVTGELPGRFVVRFAPGNSEPARLGVASLIVSKYTNASFVLSRASSDDGFEVLDPLFGHTAVLRGKVAVEAGSLEFELRLDSTSPLNGAPFEADVRATTRAAVALRLLAIDSRGVSLFDDIDFESSSRTHGARAVIDSASAGELDRQAYASALRLLETHDYFEWRLVL
jgi:hypothetical protein